MSADGSGTAKVSRGAPAHLKVRSELAKQAASSTPIHPLIHPGHPHATPMPPHVTFNAAKTVGSVPAVVNR